MSEFSSSTESSRSRGCSDGRVGGGCAGRRAQRRLQGLQQIQQARLSDFDRRKGRLDGRAEPLGRGGQGQGAFTVARGSRYGADPQGGRQALERVQQARHRHRVTGLEVRLQLLGHPGQVVQEGSQHALVGRQLAVQTLQRPDEIDAGGAGVLGDHGGQPCGGGAADGFDLLRPPRQAPKQTHEGVDLVGLADMVVHARGQAGFTVGGHRIGRHRHDRQVRVPEVVTDVAGGCQAIHHRHLQVHQHDVEGRLGGGHGGHRFLPIGGDEHPGAFVFQQFPRHLLVVGVVLGDQQAQSSQALAAAPRQPVARGAPAIARAAPLPRRRATSMP